MTGAQLGDMPRLRYFYTQTPETVSLKGTGELRGKGWNNENSWEHTHKKKRLAQRGREEAVSVYKLCGRIEWEDEAKTVRIFYLLDARLMWLTSLSFDVDFRPRTSATWKPTTQQLIRQTNSRKAKLLDYTSTAFLIISVYMFSWGE